MAKEILHLWLRRGIQDGESRLDDPGGPSIITMETEESKTFEDSPGFEHGGRNQGPRNAGGL